MRWFFAAMAAAVALCVACARPYPPPGGDEDQTPPRVVSVSPEPMTVVEGWDEPVVFRFSERVSEQRLERAVLVSPATGAVRLERNDRGAELEVGIEGGWRPGTVYRITIQPIITDLFGNQRKKPIEFVFSTGPAIPHTALAGLVRARLTGEPAVGARVEAVRRQDSLTYVALADDRGYFFLRNLPPGEYVLRAFEDRNRSLALESFEPRDSSRAELVASDTVLLGLGLLPPDSTPAQLIRAEVIDSTHIRLVFDDAFDPEWPAEDARVRLWRLPDSTAVEIASVMHAHAYEPAPARETMADSAAVAVADNVAQGMETDSLANDALPVDSVAAIGDRAASDGTPSDTAAAVPDQEGPPLPGRELVAMTAVPLAPGVGYLLEVSGAVNIHAIPEGGGSSTFQVPVPAPPDTTGAEM